MSAALGACDRALTAVASGSAASSVWLNWRREMTEIGIALEPLRPAAPPEPEILIAAAQLARNLVVPEHIPVGPPAETINEIKRFQGSIGLAFHKLAAGAQNPPSPDRIR